uniref:Uncharacterized protein n=1 Tax=Anguilla anguilla TaxID=7936 RepID=A0A0E9XKG7_ANGAN
MKTWEISLTGVLLQALICVSDSATGVARSVTVAHATPDHLSLRSCHWNTSKVTGNSTTEKSAR